MSSYTITYVTYSHRQRRLHGSAAEDSLPLPQGNVPPPSTLIIPAAPATFHGKPYAFTSVTGGKNGPLLYSDNEATPSVAVDGTNNISVKVFYLPAGGGPGQGYEGIWIDAFDEDAGDFIDDDFVTVVPNSNSMNANLTDTANAEGEVSNEKAEDIIAISPIRNLVFDKWIIAEGSGITINNEHCNLDKGGVGIAFAFYKKQVLDLNGLKKSLNETAGGGFRIIIEDDGIHIVHGPVTGGGGPIGPPVGPLGIAPSLLKKLTKEQKLQVNQYVEQYAAITKSTAADMNKLISILSSISKMVR